MMQPHRYFVQPKLPEQLRSLQTLAGNLYWNNKDFDINNLFRHLNPILWDVISQNPVSMLYYLQEQQLLTAANDPEYLRMLERVWQEYQSYQNTTSVFCQQHNLDNHCLIAFFSAEFGISEILPIYAGGLGLLAGDYLKSASDLGLSLVGVSIMYKKGYFHQKIDPSGWQKEYYPQNDLSKFPLELMRSDDNNPVIINVEFPERLVRVQIWRAVVGRINLYLLDTDCPGNSDEDRNITDCLYGGDLEKRIQQEIILGIGGMRALISMGIEPAVCHLNEGHSAFLALERIHYLIRKHRLSFSAAKTLASCSNIFTTHTPVNAGIDIFPPYLMDKYFTKIYQALALSRQEFLGLGQLNPYNQQEPFNMAVLALKLSDWANGVSRLHGRTARRMWQACWPDLPLAEVPIASITNGVHISTWISPKMAGLYDLYLGSGWRNNPVDPANWAGVDQIPDKELWQIREEERFELIAYIRRRLTNQYKAWCVNLERLSSVAGVFNPRALTIGFARRFTSYKRPTLLLRDLNRFLRLINDPRQPLQIVFAGKAHPDDKYGKEFIQQIINLSKQEHFFNRVVFLEDYDINIARNLLRGVDLWLGNPLRPMEASSTSGMKALLNGALQLSTLDGWWDEAWTLETGWAIGSRDVSDNLDYQDQKDAESLYQILEKEILPQFYNRDTDDVPKEWVLKIKNSIKAYAPFFNTHRMVQEYTTRFYVPAIENYKRFEANEFSQLKVYEIWKNHLLANWGKVTIEKVEDDPNCNKLEVGNVLPVKALLFLGELKPQDIVVEVYYGAIDNEGKVTSGEKRVLTSFRNSGAGKYLYSGDITCGQSGCFGYNLRVYPHDAYLDGHYLNGLMLWG